MVINSGAIGYTTINSSEEYIIRRHSLSHLNYTSAKSLGSIRTTDRLSFSTKYNFGYVDS